MPDSIGRVPVPPPVKSGLVFPNKLITDYGYGMTQDWKIIEHRFGDLATLGIQRYGVGSGARRFQWAKSALCYADRQALIDFYDAVQGSYQSFTYPAPNTDRKTFTNYEVVFDAPPLSITDLLNAAQTGITFLEILDPASAPTLTRGQRAAVPLRLRGASARHRCAGHRPAGAYQGAQYPRAGYLSQRPARERKRLSRRGWEDHVPASLAVDGRSRLGRRHHVAID